MTVKFKNYKTLFIGCFLLFIIFSCKEEKKGDTIDEGYIKYNIEYKGDSLDKFIATFLPKTMVLKFKDNCTKNQLKGMSGIFNFTHIKNYKDKTNSSLIKIMEKRYKYIEKINDSSLFFRDRPDIQVTYTNDTKNIAGYDCEKINITIPHEKGNLENFDIYYTDKIDIKGFNDHTPFRSVNGVLLEFQLEFYGIPLKFKATEVIESSIPSKEFEIPKGYRQINKKTMKEIISLLK